MGVCVLENAATVKIWLKANEKGNQFTIIKI